ncbi:MAG: S8 family peptidase [Bifidobacterium crudilactis]|nr:S8 family peptidase [Bifidobacterium crudilactis]MCI1889874.1 S8 family peptidase [Bifidobacterium crudilactis]
MMPDEERLPLVSFHPRRDDISRTEGSGGRDDARWVLTGGDLEQRAQLLSGQLDGLLRDITNHMKKDHELPFLMVAEMDESATSKSRRSDLVALLSVRGKDNVIGLRGERELVVSVDSIDHAEKIRGVLSNVELNDKPISCLTAIRAFNPHIHIDDTTTDFDSIKIKLIDFQDKVTNQSAQQLFENHLSALNVEFERCNYGMPVPIYKLVMSPSVTVDALMSDVSRDALYSIEPMPVASASLDSFAAGPQIPILNPVEGERYETLGILDSGVERIDPLTPWLDSKSISPYPDSALDKSHGTFVAGVAMYGDTLEHQSFVEHHGIRLLDAAVFPDTQFENVEEDELIANIREVVSRFHKTVRVWNLSISMKACVDDSHFSDFGIALDNIQHEFNVLIVKSAGNTTSFADHSPSERINQGADSVRALVVGSVAFEQGVGEMAEKGNPSPFTRVGPGPEYIIKPEVCHYGGNIRLSKTSKRWKPVGVTSFALNGETMQQAGTSFSTPRVASLATSLYQEMDGPFDPLLLKALIIHSASYDENLSIPEQDRTQYVGFGVPRSTSDILQTNPHEITLILRDELRKGQFIDILDFPMPKSLIRNGYYTGQITATLVYDPVLDSTQGLEYCQSNIDVKFGSYSSKTNRDTTKQNILNPVGREGSQNIFLTSRYGKKQMKQDTSSFAQTERQLIQYGTKYYPVKKYAVDLKNMSPANQRKCLTPDKLWYLTISGLYRNHVEQLISKEDSAPTPQPLCLIMTVKDPHGKLPIYDDVIQSLDAHNFIHSDLNVSQHVDVSNIQ